jgi:hypothetical protein
MFPSAQQKDERDAADLAHLLRMAGACGVDRSTGH